MPLLVLVQSKLSVLSWLHPHRPGSKLQLNAAGEAVVVGVVATVLDGVGGAALAGFTETEVENVDFSLLFSQEYINLTYFDLIF